MLFNSVPDRTVRASMYAASETKQPPWYHVPDKMNMSTKRKYEDNGVMALDSAPRPVAWENSGDVDRYIDDTVSTSTAAFDAQHRLTSSDTASSDVNRLVDRGVSNATFGHDGSSMWDEKVKQEPEISGYQNLDISPEDTELYYPQDHVDAQANSVSSITEVVTDIRYTQSQRITREKVGQGPFPCTICGKMFQWKGDLPRHMRIHSGHKPHNCHVCGMDFNQSGNLKLHIKAKHSDEHLYEEFQSQ
jgi:hypothetical protein